MFLFQDVTVINFSIFRLTVHLIYVSWNCEVSLITAVAILTVCFALCFDYNVIDLPKVF